MAPLVPQILYEDNHLIVAVKPAGVPSQGDISGDEAILDSLKHYIKTSKQKPGDAFLGLLHRLDRPVGGVMVFARTSKAAGRLSEQFRKRAVKKAYLAVVEGAPPEERGELRHFLVKDEPANRTRASLREIPGAKPAVLEYEVAGRHPIYTLLKVILHTGRSHQIRAQMAAVGCPIVGDLKYGSGTTTDGISIALWSYQLTIDHPTRKEEMTFTAPPPRVFPWNCFDLLALI